MTIFQNSNATSSLPSIEYKESSSINDLVIDWKKQHWIKVYQIGIVAISSAVKQMKQDIIRLHISLQNWWIN
jgi:hypothetical protein